MALQIGTPAPDFTLPSHLGKPVTLSQLRGSNVVLAFFPLAWTPIWTEQIPLYEAEFDSFAGLDTQVLGISVDSEPCLKAWATDLGGIKKYPLLSDFWPHGAVAEKYGVLRSEGHSERALFIIDREGIIRYVDVHDIDLQPSNDELRCAIRAIDPLVRVRPEPEKPAPVSLPHGGIVMYCTKWCPDCKQARAWLAARGLKYTEVDITTTPGAAEQVERWAGGNRTTPTFDIDGEIIVDFDVERLKRVLSVT